MFSYINDVSSLSHKIIKNNCKDFYCAVDATLGNGYDSDFLNSIFEEVYAFEIQKSAVDNYAMKNTKVKLIHDSHEFLMKYVNKEIDCIMYNLGFLPGGDKTITTNYETTLSSLRQGLELIRSGGLITVALYSGHPQGEEEALQVLKFVSDLPKNTFGVLQHSFLNRNNAPSLLVIEKK
jgi:hypothetical protein